MKIEKARSKSTPHVYSLPIIVPSRGRAPQSLAKRGLKDSVLRKPSPVHKVVREILCVMSGMMAGDGLSGPRSHQDKLILTFTSSFTAITYLDFYITDPTFTSA